MSTNNFYKINTDKYYIIDFGNDEWSWQNAHEIVAEEIKEIDNKFNIDYEIRSQYDLRAHPSISVGYFNYSVVALGKEWDIEFQVFLRSGYYAGATLDWEISYIGYSGIYDNIDDLLKDIEEAIEDGCIKGWNMGLWTIHKKRIEKKFQEVIDKGIKHVENILEKVAHAKAIKVAQFSNGEALYKEVD